MHDWFSILTCTKCPLVTCLYFEMVYVKNLPLSKSVVFTIPFSDVFYSAHAQELWRAFTVPSIVALNYTLCLLQASRSMTSQITTSFIYRSCKPACKKYELWNIMPFPGNECIFFMEIDILVIEIFINNTMFIYLFWYWYNVLLNNNIFPYHSIIWINLLSAITSPSSYWLDPGAKSAQENE